MKHKKNEHIEVVKTCTKMEKCTFLQCWFRHEEKESKQDFQRSFKANKPPEGMLMQEWMKTIETQLKELRTKNN